MVDMILLVACAIGVFIGGISVYKHVTREGEDEPALYIVAMVFFGMLFGGFAGLILTLIFIYVPVVGVAVAATAIVVFKLEKARKNKIARVKAEADEKMYGLRNAHPEIDPFWQRQLNK